MNRAIAAVGCMMLAWVAHAQSVEPRPTWDGPVTTDPRSTLTLVVALDNQISEPIPVGLEPDLPEGWRRLVPDTPGVVGAGATAVRIVSIFVPQEARAGEYQIPLTTVHTSSGEVLGSTAIDIVVLPYFELQIDGLDGSTHVLAGEVIEIPFRVSNRSNTDLFVDLDLETNSFYSAEFDRAPDGEITLESGASERIVATVRTPSVLTRVADYAVTVVATGRPTDPSLLRQPIRASFQSKVEIIPVISEEPVPSRTIPSRVQLYTNHLFSSSWNGEADLDFSGSGYLDEAGRHQLDFKLAPSVDLDELSINPANDTYRLNYSGRSTDLFLGDNGIAISPLLGSYVYGRGVYGRYRPGQVQASGFYSFPQTIGPIESKVGGTVDYRIPDATLPSDFSYRTSVNALSLVGSDILLGNHHEIYPGPKSAFEIDVAGGVTTTNPIVWGAMVAGGTEIGNVDVSGSALFTSPDFPGAVTDQYAITAAGGATIDAIDLRLDASTSFQQINPSLTDTLAPRVIDAALSGNLPLGTPRSKLTVGWKLRSREDMMPVRSFDQLSNSVSAATRLPLDVFDLGLTAKVDLDRETVLDTWSFGQRYNALLTLNRAPWSTQTASLAFSTQRGTVLPIDRSLTAGVSTAQDFGPVDSSARTTLSVSTRDGAFARFSALAAAVADIAFWGDHTISVDGYVEYSRDVVAGGVSGGFTIGYTAPVDLPVGRRRGLGSVEGFAFTSESGAPAEDVVLRAAGRAIVTGSEGNFRFSALTPGEYYIEVDPSRLGRGYIPDVPVPITVPVAADQMTVLDLPIVRAGTIAGAISLYSAPESGQGLLQKLTGDDDREYREDELTLVGGIQGVVVNVRRDDELRRVLSDRSGRFVISDLRPGLWTVSLTGGEIPKFHRLVKEEFLLEIQPGERAQIVFRVHPIRRPVTILQTQIAPLVVEKPDEPEIIEAVDPSDDPEPTPVPTPDPAPETRVLTPDPEITVNAPRLLGLPWGASLERVSAALDERAEPPALSGSESLGLGSDSVTVHTYFTSGVLQLGLLGDVQLTFVDLPGSEAGLYLVGVEVVLRGQTNGLDADAMGEIYDELLALFASRWKVLEMDVTTSDLQEIRSVELNGISIAYSLNSGRAEIRLEYQDNWYLPASEQ